VVIFALTGVIRRQVSEAEVLALTMLVFFLFSYIAGFLYSRHMVPMYGVMALTVAVQLTRWQNHGRNPNIFGITSDVKGKPA
jgi:hypothetical protein